MGMVTMDIVVDGPLLITCVFSYTMTGGGGASSGDCLNVNLLAVQASCG